MHQPGQAGGAPMPMLPKRGCSEPGCGAVAVDGGRCPAHQAAARQARQRSYDDRRGTTVERGYDARHRALRTVCFQRDGWRCVRCGWMPPGCFQAQAFGLEILVGSALEELQAAFAAGERHLHCDHVLPITGRDDPRRLDLGNVQTLCDTCHRRKTMKENGLRPIARMAAQGPDR